MATKAELLAEAKELGLEVTDENTVVEITAALDSAKNPIAKETPEEKPEDVAEVTSLPSAGQSEGSEIAAAIAEGLKGANGRKNFKIVADKSITPRFSVVRSKKTGEVMLRENATKVLSKVQLESIEEKEASIQGEDVEEI